MRSEIQESPGPRAAEVRSHLPKSVKQRSTLAGLFLFLASFIPYLLIYAVTLLSTNWALQLAGSVVLGILVASCFVVGHDACHGSLTQSALLNRIIARICFLPALNSYSHWDLGHNQLHHGWTNLRGMDYVWVPLTTDEYSALSPMRKLVVRFYRTVFGLGLYYLIEIWWKQGILFKETSTAKLKDKRTARFDLSLIGAFFIFQLALPVAVVLTRSGEEAKFAQAGAEIFWAIAFTAVIPFLIWNWISGLAVYIHHTHPSVVWFDNREEWDFYRGQVRGTVDLALPRIVDSAFHHIMVHTAHHVDPRIPSYHLIESQKNLAEEFGDDITHWKFNLKTFFEILSSCKLYDYRNRRWLDFSGRPSTPGL